MKILVLSDSHAALRFMRDCVAAVRPDAVIHLGDFFDDGQVLAEENPHLVVHQVPGNCDRFRCPPWASQTLIYPVGGVSMFMTHGHNHKVKMGTGALLADARKSDAKAVLYGHTHQAECYREPDGLWVMNPGSCGYGGGTAGLMEIKNGEITAARIITSADLEEMI